VNAGGDSGAMTGNGYEKNIAIDLLLISFRDMSWVQRRSRNLGLIDFLTKTNLGDGAVKNGLPPNLPWQHESFDSYVSIVVRDSIPLRYMELVTVVLALAAIIGTGALTKIGENMTDQSPQAVDKLFSWLRQRLPQSKTMAALQAGKDVDYQQAVIELEPILTEGEGAELLAEVRSAVEANQELKLQLEKVIANIQSQPQYVQNNHNQAQGIQINVNGNGKLEAQNIGGNHNHYYGVKPD
jgi:hypothetical protein